MRRVVVTGMGIISPIGNDIETFYNNLAGGVCGIGPITRFDTQNYKVKVAAEVKAFDPAMFGMDKTEIRRSDLYAQYAQAAAAQAMEQSGILGQVESERLGVYMSSGIGGIGTFMQEHQKLLEQGPRRVSPLFIPKMISNIAAGNIAMRYHAYGPCLPVVTACATSTMAVGEAYLAIAHDRADAIIAGGAEAAINEMGVAGFTSCMALSLAEDPAQACLPFDRRRSGFVMGEGGAALVLEEYEHARKRGANIICEVLGYTNTCDAHHMTAPDPEATQSARAIRMAAEQAGWSTEKEQSVYINAHGTGTALNDKTETLAIKKAFGEQAYRMKVSSTKSMTGHMLGATGAAEAICIALALQHDMLPPTIGYAEADPECDLDYVPGKAQWQKVDLALSVSLGFGGHNGCIAFGKCEEV